MKIAWFRDPAGNLLALIEDQGAGSQDWPDYAAERAFASG